MQSTPELRPSMSGSPLVAFAVSLFFLPLSVGAVAQAGEVSQATTAVVIPQQVRYMGAAPNRAGVTVEAVFKIYASAEGGEALWTETQQVAVGADGAYSVLLGAASQSGLPQGVFAAGQARWVGVSVDRGEEQARSPLSSVAYAMKAGDAESVGGLAAASLATKSDLAKLAQTVTTVQAQPQFRPEVTPTGSGTTDYVPLWTDSGTLGSSGIFQAASGNIGIGTTTPGGPLQLATGAQGGANATMMLTQTSAASGNYYADIGLYNTHGLIGNLSALGAGYPAGNLFGANDVVFLGGQQNAGTNLVMLTNTSGAIKFGTGGYAVANERLRISATGGVSVGNSYVGTDPGAGSLIVSGNTGIGTSAPAAKLEVNGTAKFDGLITFAAGQTFPGGGGGTITAVTASSPLTGGGTSGSVALGLNTSALETTLNGVYVQLGAANTFGNTTTFSHGIVSNMAAGSGFAANYYAVDGEGTNGATGLFGRSDSGYGVEGTSTSGTGVYGAAMGADVSGVEGYASGSGGYGVYAWSAGAGDSVRTAAGVHALADSGNGVEGFNSGESATYYALAHESEATAGVWGDTDSSYGAALAGVVGTAYGNTAGEFVNNDAIHPTLVTMNMANNDTGPTGLFRTFKATTNAGTCGIGDGILRCTGQVETLATTGGGSRTVETYAMQSPENWMEDFGTGAIQRGVGVVQIDATFAETMTADGSYHVFLTPRGDSEGHLYVTNVTANSFEVRESHGGTSSLSFDYRIVGKRRGYEAQRMVDVTDRLRTEEADTKRQMSGGMTARASRSAAGSRVTGHPESLVRAGTLPSTNAKAGVGLVGTQAPAVPR